MYDAYSRRTKRTDDTRMAAAAAAAVQGTPDGRTYKVSMLACANTETLKDGRMDGRTDGRTDGREAFVAASDSLHPYLEAGN